MFEAPKKILGIIPARGGSKSIPLKNIKSFLGKPLLAWSIEALKNSGVVDRIIVSTDHEGIAKVAKNFGAEAPFMRPSELAEDTTPTLPVLQHALKWLKENEGYYPDIVVLSQATSPGIMAFHLREGMGLFLSNNTDSVVSVSEVPAGYSPYWQFQLASSECRLTLFTGAPVKNVIKRRQDLPKTYVRNSAFYIFKPSLLFEEEPSFYGENVKGYVMKNKYSVDIDTPDDWLEAENKLKSVLSNGK